MSARSSATLVAVHLSLLALLGGCLSPDANEAPGAAPLANATLESPGSPPTPPDNRSGGLAAFEETNDTASGTGGLDHAHDYWKGRTRVELLRERLQMNPGVTRGDPAKRLNLPYGALVYESTAAVEFLADKPERHACVPNVQIDDKYVCTDDHAESDRVPAAPAVPDPAPPTLTLEYLHAAGGTGDWLPAGEIPWGTPVVIPIREPRETDMPHATRSLWEFRIVPSGPLDATLTFEATVTILRGPGEIPTWPGHPEFYADGHERVVFQGQATSKSDGTQGLAFDSQLVHPGKLVSHGTRTLFVYANITSKNTPPGLGPVTWYLLFKNASGELEWTDPMDPGNRVDAATSLRFVLPVDDNGMDSPYAASSRWGFALHGSLHVQAPGFTFTCPAGCAVYEVTYDLTVVASDLEAEAYTRASNSASG